MQDINHITQFAMVSLITKRRLQTLNRSGPINNREPDSTKMTKSKIVLKRSRVKLPLEPASK